MKIKHIIAAALLSVGLMGCSTFKASDAFARKQIDLLRSGNVKEALSCCDQSINTPELEQNIQKVSDILNKPDYVSTNFVKFTTVYKDKDKQTTINYQIHYKNGLISAVLIIKNAAGKDTLLGIRVDPITQAVQEENGFTFAGKTFVHYDFLVMTLLFAAFNIFVFVYYLRTKIKHRWYWTVFIILGLIKFNLNWTTGAIDYQIIGFQLFSASFFKQFYGPLTLSFSVPVGAICFLFKRPELIAEAKKLELEKQNAALQEANKDDQVPPVEQEVK